MSRYSLEHVKLDKGHPLDPNRWVYKIWDAKYQNYIMSYYLSEKAGQAALDKRRSR